MLRFLRAQIEPNLGRQQIEDPKSNSDGDGDNQDDPHWADTVVVVGDQSSGESTLLEALSLVELLKGSGIVTRCPLVLRLRTSNQRRFYRLKGNEKRLLEETYLNIFKYIEDETASLAGNQKNVVSEMIELQVEDPNVRDLTVVDLPGIVRNPIADQPTNIHQQTTHLIQKFIDQPSSVICISSCSRSRRFTNYWCYYQSGSSSGSRQIRFIAVRNRSADEQLSLEDARQCEKEFFTSYPTLLREDTKCVGIDALINRLADLYTERVRETFPKIQSSVAKQLSKIPPDLQSNQSRLVKYHETVNWYVNKFLPKCLANFHDGKSPSIINALHHKFNQVEKVIEGQNREIYLPQYRVRVRDAMSACFGEQLPNFLPHPVLKQFIIEKIDAFWRLIEVLIDASFQLVLNRISDNDKAACNDDVLLLK